MAKNSMIGLYTILGVLFGALIVGGIFFAVNQGSITGTDGKIEIATNYYDQEILAQRDFSTTITLKDELSGGTAIASATVYVFKEKPEDWLDYEADFSNADPDRTETTDANGQITFSENPQSLYLVVVKSRYKTGYNVYEHMVGDNAQQILTTEDLNTFTVTEEIFATAKGTLTVENFNLLIDANSSSYVDETDTIQIEVSADQKVIVGSMIFNPNSGLTNDTDSDDISDLGVKTIEFQIAGNKFRIAVDELVAGDSEKYVLYDAQANVFKAIELEDEEIESIKVVVNTKTNTNSSVLEALGESQTIGTLSLKDVYGDTAGTITLTS